MQVTNKQYSNYGLVLATLLLIPFVANILMADFNWDAADFIVFGILLVSCLGIIEFVKRKVSSKTLQGFAIVLVIVLFLLVWAEMGVGLFGSIIAGD